MCWEIWHSDFVKTDQVQRRRKKSDPGLEKKTRDRHKNTLDRPSSKLEQMMILDQGLQWCVENVPQEEKKVKVITLNSESEKVV